MARKARVQFLRRAQESDLARFHPMERELKNEGKKLGEVDLTEMDQVWNRVKASIR